MTQPLPPPPKNILLGQSGPLISSHLHFPGTATPIHFPIWGPAGDSDIYGAAGML